MCFWREPPKRIPKSPEVFFLARLRRSRGQPLRMGSSALGISRARAWDVYLSAAQLSMSPEAIFNTRWWIFHAKKMAGVLLLSLSSDVHSSVYSMRSSSLKEVRVKDGSLESFLVKNLCTRPQDTIQVLLPFPETFQEYLPLPRPVWVFPW